MKYFAHKKLQYELSKLSKLNSFIPLGYQKNTDASSLVYKYHPERTGFNMYAENTQQQLTFLTLLPCFNLCLAFLYPITQPGIKYSKERGEMLKLFKLFKLIKNAIC